MCFELNNLLAPPLNQQKNGGKLRRANEIQKCHDPFGNLSPSADSYARRPARQRTVSRIYSFRVSCTVCKEAFAKIVQRLVMALSGPSCQTHRKVR